MKKLLFILLPVFFFTLAVNAQTEDEIYIGKGKTFGNYNGKGIIIPDFGRNAKPVMGQTTVTGIVTGVVVGREGDRDTLTGKRSGQYSFTLKQNDGIIILIGTRDYGFTIPKNLVGRKITVEGIDAISGRKRMTAQENQKNIQFAATGIKVID
jgi:hypothetical protein